MTRKRLTVMGVALAASAAVVLPMTSAQADNDDHYPPYKHIHVSATPNPNPQHPTQFKVVVSGASPKCWVKVSVRGTEASGPVDQYGNAVLDLVVGPISGPYTIHARTYGCKAISSASTKVVVTKYKLLGPTTVRAGEKFSVQATGWLPSLPITFTISDGNKTLSFATETGPDGRVTQGVSVPYPGTWAVVVSQQGGPTKSYALEVTTASKHHDADGSHKTPTSQPKPKAKPKSAPKAAATSKPTPKPTHH